MEKIINNENSITYRVFTEEEFKDVKNEILEANDDKSYLIIKKELENGLLKELPYGYDLITKKFLNDNIVYVIKGDEQFKEAELRIKKLKGLYEYLTIRKEILIEKYKHIYIYSYDSKSVLNKVDVFWEDENGYEIKNIEYTPEMKEIAYYEFENYPNGDIKHMRQLDTDRSLIQEEFFELGEA